MSKPQHVFVTWIRATPAEVWNGITKLVVTHDDFPKDSVVFEGVGQGWPWILHSLKTLLETGEPLPNPA